MTAYRLGRKSRSYNPSVPHYSALIAGRPQPLIPDNHDYTLGMPDDLGMMLNDQLGDCTIAGLYHGRQVWTYNAQNDLKTESDAIVEKAYELIDGYVPGDPNTDQGGIEQHVLRYCVKKGIPLDNGTHDKFAAFVEIDKRNVNDIKHGIYEGGFVYIGFKVPDYLMAGVPPPVWDFTTGQSYQIVGGHCVILPGYTATNLFKLISWGAKYQMTKAFWDEFVDEAYVIADSSWISATGRSPAGFTLTELEQQMSGLRNAV